MKTRLVLGPYNLKRARHWQDTVRSPHGHTTTNLCGSFFKAEPVGKPLKCGAVIHHWLGMKWYGVPYPLRWRGLYNSLFLTPMVRRQPIGLLVHGPRFCPSFFEGCGCIYRLKNAYNRIKKLWKRLRGS